jgi:hypothetical protein
MTSTDWSILIGLIVALAPWMFMVHARLAVLAAAVAALETKVDKLLAAHEEQLPACAVHVARVCTLEDQVARMQEALQGML